MLYCIVSSFVIPDSLLSTHFFENYSIFKVSVYSSLSVTFYSFDSISAFFLDKFIH